MKTPLVALHLLFPFINALCCMVFAKKERAKKILSLSLTLIHVGIFISHYAIVHHHHFIFSAVGSWSAPYGIVLYLDSLSWVLIGVTLLLHLASQLFTWSEKQHSWHLSCFHLLIASVIGSFLAGDLFNLYVWFEIMLMSSFALMSLHRSTPVMKGMIYYLVMNLLGSTFFLLGIALTYSALKALNLQQLSLLFPQLMAQNPTLVSLIALFFLVGFCMKAAVFPFHFWLPESYPQLPAKISAPFAGLLTKVGVYSLLRIFVLFFLSEIEILFYLSLPTMFLGVLGAYAQKEIPRILSFHIISQIGYMIFGLGLLAQAPAPTQILLLSALLFYVVHHIVVKSNLFFISGIIAQSQGTTSLEKLGGLVKHSKFLAFLFLIPALSLAGLPPFSGFWAKLTLIQAALHLTNPLLYLAIGVALITSLFTLMSMFKIWDGAFIGKSPAEMTTTKKIPFSKMLTCTLLGLVTLILSFFPGTLYRHSEQASRQLLLPSEHAAHILLQNNTPSRGDHH